MQRLLVTLVSTFVFLQTFSQGLETMAKSDSLYSIGVHLYQQEKYSEAIPLFEESDKIDKAILDSMSNRRDYSAMWLASCYYKLGNEKEAQIAYPDYYMLIPVDRRETIEIDSLKTLAEDCLTNRNYTKCIQFYKPVLDFYENYFNTSHIETAQIAYLIGMCYYLQKEFAPAIPYLEKSLEQYQGMNLRCTDEELLYGYIHLTESLYMTQSWNKIISLSNDFIQLYRTSGENNIRYKGTLCAIALVAYNNGYIEKSIEAYKEVYDALRYNHMEQTEEYCQIIDNLCLLYNKERKYKEALTYANESYKYNRIVKGENDKSQITIFRNISTSNFFLGNYLDAIEYEEKALKLSERYYGRLSMDYAISLLNLSQFQNYNGDYAKAINYINENISILNQIGKKNSQDHAVSLSFLSNYYSQVEQNRKALELCQAATDIFKREGGIESPGYARSLNNLSFKYSEIGNDEKAYEIGVEANILSLKVFGEENIDYINTVANLASYSQKIGKTNESDSLYRKGLDLLSRYVGRFTPQYYTVLSNYAGFKTILGDFDNARKLQSEAINIIREIVGEDHIDYIRALQILAILNFGHNTNEMYQLAKTSTSLLKKYMKSHFFLLSAVDRQKLWNSPSFNSWYMIMIPAMDYYHNFECKNLGEMDYDAVLLSKNYLLNVENEIKDIINISGDIELSNLYKKWQDEKARDAAIADSLESNLNLRIAKYLDDNGRFVVWSDVKKQLKKEDVAIEFRIAPVRNDSIMYCALVLRQDMSQPTIVPLFESKEIKKIPSKDYYTSAQISLLVWKPLEKYINDVRNIYFSADAQLNNIAIEYVPHWEKTVPISDMWNVYRLSSTGELTKTSTKKRSYKHASVFGGIKYDSDTTLLIADSQRYQEKRRALLSYEDYTFLDSLDIRGGVSYLPATKIEAEEIYNTLSKINISTSIRTDTLATEGTFKNLSKKGIDILHIATHGFFWTEHEAKYRTDLNFLMLGNKVAKTNEDKALTRSGLLFAGANNALKGKKLPDNVDDGIVTAKEISQLNFQGLDLVVLSACQTGLGEISGDGVFGLQRGFKKAGAQSLLMSLWKVDDTATQLLMTRFYKNMATGMSKHESLKQAQKFLKEYEVDIEMKADSRPSISAHAKMKESQNKDITYKKVKKYNDPYYWAAFILLDAIN